MYFLFFFYFFYLFDESVCVCSFDGCFVLFLILWFSLVVSSTSGSVDRVLDRVAKINKSGDFGALLCIGTFHNEKDQRESKYLNGSSSCMYIEWIGRMNINN